MFSIGLRVRKKKHALLSWGGDFVRKQHVGDLKTKPILSVEKEEGAKVEVEYSLEIHCEGTVFLARKKRGRTAWFRVQDEAFQMWLRNVPLGTLRYMISTLHIDPNWTCVPRPRQPSY